MGQWSSLPLLSSHWGQGLEPVCEQGLQAGQGLPLTHENEEQAVKWAGRGECVWGHCGLLVPRDMELRSHHFILSEKQKSNSSNIF